MVNHYQAALAGSVYSKSKARTELWLRELQAKGAPVTATYPGGVQGPYAPTLTEMHRSLPLQLRITLTTDGGMNFIDVRDLAAIHVAIFKRPPEAERWIAGGVFLTFPGTPYAYCPATSAMAASHLLW